MYRSPSACGWAGAHPAGTCAAKGMGPLAIGPALTLIHLISIPVTNTSVNPARSTGPALFVGGWALSQLWLFWLAPLLGAAMTGIGYRSAATHRPVGRAPGVLIGQTGRGDRG